MHQQSEVITKEAVDGKDYLPNKITKTGNDT